jgi:N-acetylneuraminate synthase
MANEEEIGAAIDTAREAGCQELVVMHCVSAYPAPASDYNLRTLADIGVRHHVLAGLSDHTLDNATAIAAIALGACVIEKHFTLDRSGGGPDDSFSLEPAELHDLCRDCRTSAGIAARPGRRLVRSITAVKTARKAVRCSGDRFTWWPTSKRATS